MISTKIKDIDMLSVPKHFIEVGFKKLAVGGKLVMVTKRLVWYKKKERKSNKQLFADFIFSFTADFLLTRVYKLRYTLDNLHAYSIILWRDNSAKCKNL